ncbi:MAG: helix-turn-helix domain-containing protein [Treponemataceae bacterium]|nr:helix-turn-helix domain-containing protein [Treponemataceae bacterium]
MTNIQMCLSRNMKFHRKRLGLSQAALAEKAETAPNYIALIEVGKSFPSLPMMEKIAAALQVDALDLFDKDGLISIDKNSLRADVLERISRAVEDAFDSHSVCP